MNSLKTHQTYQFIVILIMISNLKISVQLKRDKRFLIFPRQAPTRHQFIGGIGIPVELSYESLTVGYVLKAEFWLPWNSSIVTSGYTLHRERIGQAEGRHKDFKRSLINKSNLREQIYNLLITKLDSYGYNGKECLLKALCEANAFQFIKNYDVVMELIHIFFSPSYSVDQRNYMNYVDYQEAEKLGLTGSDCSLYYCNLSFLDLISQVLKTN